MKKSLFFFLLAIIIIIISYLTLVILDIILPRISKYNKNYFNAQKELIRPDIDFINFQVLQSNKKIKKTIQDANLIPLGTLPYTSNIFCNEGYGKKIFKSDRFGFRNKDEIWKNISEIEAILIGDSFAAGACVDDKFTISHLLTEKNIKTLNLSIPGYSPLNYKILNKVFTKKINPKYLIILLYQNDNTLLDKYSIFNDYENIIEPKYYFNIFDNELRPSKRFENLNKDLKSNLYEYSKNSNYTKLNEFLFKIKKYLFLPNVRKFLSNIIFKNNLLGYNKSLVNDVIETCKAIKCKPIFALIRASNYWDPQYFYEDYKNSLQNYLAQEGLSLVTFEESINFKKLKFYSPNGGHLSKLGYKLVSEKLYKTIILKD